MFHFYLKSTLRLIARDRVMSGIKIGGLAMGLGAFVLIGLYVKHEFSFDTWHPGADRIYRYVHRVKTPEGLQSMAFTSATTGPALKERFPEIETFTRALTITATFRNPANDIGFNETRLGFVDPNFLNFFTFPVQGEHQPADLLREPYSLVMTPSAASRYFGTENPVGKTLIVNGQMQFVVRGVLEADLNRTHFNYDLLASFATLEAIGEHPALSSQIPASLNLENKGFAAFYTYVRLARGASVDALVKKFPAFIEDFRGKGRSERLKPTLQALTSIHLNSDLLYEIDRNGSRQSVLVFLAIGIAISLIACVNYVNLSTAEFVNRMRGIMLKKILGVSRMSLLASHITETAVISLVAVIVATILAFLFLPTFESLVNRRIEFSILYLGYLLSAIWLATAAVAGSYPALVISKVGTLATFRGNAGAGGTLNLRTTLVFFQILISFCLLSITFLIFQQLRYMTSKDLGFQPNHVVVVNASGTTMLSRDAFKTAVLDKPGILSVGGCSTPPGLQMSSLGLLLKENPSDEDRRVGAFQTYADPSLLSTLGVKMLSGRDFDERNPADSSDYIIVNEAAEELLADSTGHALGREVRMPDFYSGNFLKKTIIGVMANFHFESLQKRIEPLILECNPSRIDYVLVRSNHQQKGDVIDVLRRAWTATNPTSPFDYYFLDQGITKLYDSERRLKGVVLFCACLAIGLAALGLFGTTLFTVQQRTREIGIRKALGSDGGQLFVLLIRPVAILIFASCSIGVPLAYLAGGLWLNQYAFSVTINPLLFGLSFSVILSIVLLSLIYHFRKVSKVNPSQVLREN